MKKNNPRNDRFMVLGVDHLDYTFLDRFLPKNSTYDDVCKTCAKKGVHTSGLTLSEQVVRQSVQYLQSTDAKHPINGLETECCQAEQRVTWKT